MSTNIGVAISPDSLEVAPGEQIQAVIKLRNTSNVVDVFSIEVEGLKDWCELTTNSASLFPGDSAESTLTISPSAESASLAKVYKFEVRVTSQKDPSQIRTASAELEVTAFYSFESQLQPERAVGAAGAFTLHLTNTGNADLVIGLEGSDTEGRCHFSIAPQVPRVVAGDTLDVAVRIEARRRPWIGQSRVRDFAVSASPTEGTAEPTTVNGQLEVTPWLPKWVVVAIIGALLLIAVIAAIIFFLSLRGPEEGSVDFVLNPGESTTTRFDLPKLEPMVLEVTARWEGTADALDVVLEYPDGTEVGPFRVTPSSPTVSFQVDDLGVRQGLRGWAISLMNPSANGQATGTLLLKRTETR